MKTIAIIAGAAALAVTSTSAVYAADDAKAREQRWTELRQSVFGDKPVEQKDGFLSLDAPVRAEDAALVPMDIKVSNPDQVKGLTLVIDENPGPVAAKIDFGPAGDPGLLRLRTRVNAYSNVHAVAETKDGKLVETVKFVKASGGCSAPVGGGADDAKGEMRLKVAGDATPGKSAQATLMIRHPNFNGMQKDQQSHLYTPANYIKDIKVTYNDKDVFAMTSDISLSTNPVIEFGFKPEAQGQFKVVANDTSGARYEKTFDIPTKTQ